MRANDFGDGGGECDDVVLYFALDFMNAGDVETRVGTQGSRGGYRARYDIGADGLHIRSYDAGLDSNVRSPASDLLSC